MAIFLLLLMIYGVVCVLFAINFIVRFSLFFILHLCGILFASYSSCFILIPSLFFSLCCSCFLFSIFLFVAPTFALLVSRLFFIFFLISPHYCFMSCFCLLFISFWGFASASHIQPMNHFLYVKGTYTFKIYCFLLKCHTNKIPLPLPHAC